MASICLELLLVSTFLISSQQQALFTETQQQQFEENEIERKISEKLEPLVNEYATNAFNAAIEELRQKFTTEIKLLTDEIDILANRSTQVEEAFNDITTVNTAKGRLGCPETTDGRFLLYGTNCYMFRIERLTWPQAKEWCAAKNAHLARITSIEINLYLKKECGLRNKQFWLGGHDVIHEGEWIWDDGDPIDSDLMDWGPGEPNNYGGSQDCLGIGHGRRLQWDDKRCDTKLEFICETAAVKNE